jgi:hypothetical protein
MVSSEVGECRKRTGERFSFKINEQLVTVILYCNGRMQAQAFECAVGMVAPTSTVRSLLELTNVASLFEIFPDVQTAIASLAAEVA